jgi:hypothetical protein
MRYQVYRPAQQFQKSPAPWLTFDEGFIKLCRAIGHEPGPWSRVAGK